MPAYSYKRRFIEPMLWGRKDGTIRARRMGRSRHAQPGDSVANYVGMRTKACELILRSVCVENLQVTLRWRPIVELIVADEKMAIGDFDVFAVRDGFDDFNDMERFWFDVHHRIDCFRGELIRWLAPTTRVEMGADLTPKARAA